MSNLAQTQALQSMAGAPTDAVEGQPSAITQPGGGDSGIITGGAPGGAASASPGAAGSGSRWTNIQSYLKANQGDTGSSQALQNRAQSVFGEEKQKAQSGLDEQKQSAQQAVESSMGQDRASELISGASQNYKYAPEQKNLYQVQDYIGPQNYVYGGNTQANIVEIDDNFADYNGKKAGGTILNPTGYQPVYGKLTPPGSAWGNFAPPAVDQSYQGNFDAYMADTGQVRDALSAQYAGPREYAHGIGADTQRYGNIDDQSAYQTVMNEVYNQAAGKDLTGGQLALQRQLDVSNPNLTSARQQVLSDYAGLESDIGDINQLGTQDLSGYQDQFYNKQTELADYLASQGQGASSAAFGAESQALNDYLGSFADDSNRQAALYGWDTPSINPQAYGDDASRMGNLSWGGLENEHQYYDQNVGNKNFFDSGVSDKRRANRQALNNYYNEQRAQNWLAGDEDKRRYNTIMDILGLDNRFSQGYDVKG